MLVLKHKTIASQLSVLVLIIEGNHHLLKKVRPILLVEVEEHFTVTVCCECHLQVYEDDDDEEKMVLPCGHNVLE